MTDIDTLLEQRHSTHGDFVHTSNTYSLLQASIQGFYTNPDTNPMHKLAVDVILQKLARIVNGDPYFEDHWVDIIGYCTKALEAKRV